MMYIIKSFIFFFEDSNMHQCIFDELIQFVLETVSSESYLQYNNIYRPSSVNWADFTKKVKKQSVRPGIYARSFGRGQGVHYYSVRKEEDGTLLVGNGYPSIAGLDKKYAVGLNVQKDHSHGLCQTFALMFYFHKEDRLKPGNYWENILIGFKFLLEFIKEDYVRRERCWSVDEILENIQILCSDKDHIKERIMVLKKIKGRSRDICLSGIIKVILKSDNQEKLINWLGSDIE